MADLLRFFCILRQKFDFVGAITFFHVSRSNLLRMLLIRCSRTHSMIAEKQTKMVDLLRFLSFHVNNLTLRAR